MGKPSLPLRVLTTFLLSLSVTASSCFSSPPYLQKLSSVPKATPSDLFSLLGPKAQSCTINPLVAQHLEFCLNFLVPFTPTLNPLVDQDHNFLHQPSDRNQVCARRRRQEAAAEIIWWPPEEVRKLARLAVHSGGNTTAIRLALDLTNISVPRVEGYSEENKCKPQSTRLSTDDDICFTTKRQELNAYLEFLFELIVDRGPTIGLNISLSRYDFYHGHLFVATDTGRLGILFHAKEYPALDEVFRENLGFCQKGTNVKYDDSMNLRNILWLAPMPSNDSSSKDFVAPGVLVALDAHPEGVIYRDLVHQNKTDLRTIDEEQLAKPVVDVNYLDVRGQDAVPRDKIFIC